MKISDKKIKEILDTAYYLIEDGAEVSALNKLNEVVQELKLRIKFTKKTFNIKEDKEEC
jgi:hypothetical protein